MMLFRKFVLLICCGIFSLAAQEILPFDNDAERQLYLQLTAELRCPQCQNQNIADSNAVVSLDMRQKTYEMVREGKTRQEVLDYMIDRYGYFVHYKPPMNKYTLFLWFSPLLLIVLLVVVLLKRRQQQQAEPAVSQDLSSELDKIIDAYRNKKP